MASALTSKNRVYLFRLQILLIDGGNLVIRNIFNQKLQGQNSTLTVCLAQEKHKIVSLKTQKAITQTQYDLLFPQGGQAPSIVDFDISLTICLLRNLKMCGLNPKYSWKSTPQSSDLSVEADITRLRIYRNEIAHISETTGIQLNHFRFKWAEIEQILLRLNNSVLNPVPDLQQIIDDFKTCSLDQNTEQRLHKEIEVWRKFEKGLEEDIQRLQKDVLASTESVFTFKRDLKAVKVDVQASTESGFTFKKDLKAVKEDVQASTESVFTFKKDLKAVKEDVQASTESVFTFKRDLKAVKEDVQASTESVFTFKKDLKAVKKDVETLTHVTSKNLEDTRNRVDKLENLTTKKDAINQKQKQELQQDLVEFYRQRHQKLPLSPLFEDDNTPLLKFYVMPDINSVKVQRAFGGGNEIKTPIKTLRNAFFEGSSQFKDIYLSADAGLGKTAFSKRLAMTWCQAHTPNENETELFKKDEIDAVNNFDFLFLIFLRDSSGKCDIVDLINDQIIQDLPSHGSPLSKQDIDTVLSEKRCLVVLDGLDEWTHPTSCDKKANGIPHSKVYKKCTVLTTSRPWKLNDIDSSSPRFELVKLNRPSKRLIQERVISQLTEEKDEKKLQDQAQTFSTAVAQLDISDVDSIPLLLMYLLCLWCDERSLGQSLCELYSNIVELLLSRTVKKYKNLKLPLPQVDKRATDGIPQCFHEQKCCTQYYTLLETLANLAVQTLFSETKGEKLVFDSTTAEKYLNEELLQFCLESGILSQTKDRAKRTKQKAKISFAHKTVQEFFAALYMHSVPDQTIVQNKVLSQCNSVKDILEMSKVFIFLSGINVDVFSFISRELIEVINKDEITQKYRAMTHVYDPVKYTQPLKELQDMYISCVKENPQNTKLKLFHQDIIIDRDCRQKNCLKYVKQLAVQNKENIRSVSVTMEGIPYSVQEIIDNCELTDLSSVDKMYYWGEFDNCDITPLLHRSVKCLTLWSHKWQDDQFIPVYSTWSTSLSSRCYSLDNLECIYIFCFVMSHDELEKIVKHFSTRNSMREISLFNLHCKDHKDSCAGVSLELCQHSQLKTLRLGDIPLSKLNINVASLEECNVGHLSKPGLVSRYLSSLPAASKLQTFQCSDLKSTEDIETMLTTLRKLVHVKDVTLFFINLGNREPLSPEMVNIEYVLLHKVTMTAAVFSHLVNQVNKQQQTVTVQIRGCTITPEDEFKKEKDKIKMSPDFSVAHDDIHQYYKLYHAFVFTTIK